MEDVSEHPLTSVPVTVNDPLEAGGNGTPSVTPPLHVYEVEVPLPVKVTGDPRHTAIADAFAVTVGKVFTTTVTVAELVHPVASVPVTV
jgi:hypothetical protein